MSLRKDDLLTRGPYYQRETLGRINASTTRHLITVRRHLRNNNATAAREAFSLIRRGDAAILKDGGITSAIKKDAKELSTRIDKAEKELTKAEKRAAKAAERLAKKAAKL